MLKYVLSCPPSDVDSFMMKEDKRLTRAMKATVRNLVGSLPRTFFDVKVSCVAESLAQLMMTLLMTGYVFHSAKQRMEMLTSLSSVMSLTSTSSDEEEYAPGVQKKDISGQILKWSHRNGIESMSAVAYIEQLEHEISRLKEDLSNQRQSKMASTSLALSRGGGSQSMFKQVALPSREDGSVVGWGQGGKDQSSSAALEAVGAAVAGGGELMDFMNEMEPGTSASPETIEAMTAFVERMMGTSDTQLLKSMQSEFDTYELSKVFIWLLVVGYALRTAESKLDVDEGDDISGFMDGRGPGDDDGKGGQGGGGWDWGRSLWSKLLPGGGRA